MAQTTKATRQNRTITVNFQDPSTYFQRIRDGKAFVAFVLAFLLSLGFQLAHKATCTGGGCLTRHSHYARMRLGGLTIWRVQCTLCRAVVAVLVKCRLPLPTYILADEKHSCCLTDRVYLPTIVSGRVLWHLGYSASKSAAAFTASYGAFQRMASH